MDAIKNFLAGKKTYLLVLVYVILVLSTGTDVPADDALMGIDPNAIKEALIGLMVATAKAAWDRFSNK